MAKVAYLRVSTKHQAKNGGGLIRQEYAMPADIDKTFIDEASAKDTQRPEFKKMMDYIREGDTVYFESFSRISRSLPDLLNILDEFGKKGVAFVSLKENINTEGATGKLIVSLLGAINAYEREINEERRAFGYKRAYEEGKVGRPQAIGNEAFYEAVKQWRAGEIKAVEAIEKSGLPKPTFYRMVKRENL